VPVLKKTQVLFIPADNFHGKKTGVNSCSLLNLNYILPLGGFNFFKKEKNNGGRGFLQSHHRI
jgi:hypothetical protein